jgi:hypothetical protein
MSVAVTCPSCGEVNHLEVVSRSGKAFCWKCDYPLFWAPTAQTVGASIGDTGLRRLPGTGGLLAPATIDCPACSEPNPEDATICIRCGAELRPQATLVAEPPPPPALPPPVPDPTPAPPRRLVWPWVLVGTLAVIAVVALVVLLVTGG